ncbi:hypothetical protein BDP27DRAFT_1366047 [Rhodocollybia butyracea]|uniref:Uncharacterized protein n=1 Tax=Rhodocollybia butyracea TaxID=206335 RepID=A0A9P5PNU4_9AGAR|nr:hypothetical protein BDP27DRAFT_1366047 [Rhodocollybia butyracea]
MNSLSIKSPLTVPITAACRANSGHFGLGEGNTRAAVSRAPIRDLVTSHIRAANVHTIITADDVEGSALARFWEDGFDSSHSTLMLSLPEAKSDNGVTSLWENIVERQDEAPSQLQLCKKKR